MRTSKRYKEILQCNRVAYIDEWNGEFNIDMPENAFIPADIPDEKIPGYLKKKYHRTPSIERVVDISSLPLYDLQVKGKNGSKETLFSSPCKGPLITMADTMAEAIKSPQVYFCGYIEVAAVIVTIRDMEKQQDILVYEKKTI